MTFLKSVRHTIQALFDDIRPSPSLVLPGEGERPAARDTLSAISDLSRLVRNDPEAIDIYLTLGNLFRSQGDIERAVMIRETLIARPGLNVLFTARAYFELGADYSRAGVIDRALAAFRQAGKLGYPQDAVTAKTANLFAQAGDFMRASEEYARLKRPLAQAHYLVRHAKDAAIDVEPPKAERLLKKALRIYPGSIEAWSSLVFFAAAEEAWKKLAALLEKGFVHIAPQQQFLLLDSLLTTEKQRIHLAADKKAPPSPSSTSPETPAGFAQNLCEAVMPVLQKQKPHILLHYYAALLWERAENIDAVEVWLAKALIVQPDFWAARLLSLELSRRTYDLPPIVSMQIVYFADALQDIKRFACAVCGFHESRIFYRCRRCGSWHSLTFRLSLQE